VIQEPRDFPKDELIEKARMASEIYLKNGVSITILFKWTCPACGKRCVCDTPNTLFETGKCHICGTVTFIEKGGFCMVIEC
jgi:hypothetical protein